MNKEQELLELNNKVELVDIEKLIPYAKNNKDHNEEQILQLASMIAAFKKVDPIRLDKNYVIESGHGRVLALKKLGYTHAPCIIQHDSDEYQSMAFRIGHNKIADQATYNVDNMAFDIGTLQSKDINLDLLGMTDIDIAAMLNKFEVDKEIIGESLSVESDFILEVTFSNEQDCTEVYEEMLSRGLIARVKK